MSQIFADDVSATIRGDDEEAAIRRAKILVEVLTKALMAIG